MSSRDNPRAWRDPFLKRILSYALVPISVAGLLGTLFRHPTFHDISEPTGGLPYFFAVLLLIGVALLVSSLRDTLSPWSRLYRLLHPELWRRAPDR